MCSVNKSRHSQSRSPQNLINIQDQSEHHGDAKTPEGLDDGADFCAHTQELPPINGWLSQAFIGMISIYQGVFSPMTGANCRYLPTCSSYAVIAIRVHGSVNGSALALWRLLRCNPLSKGGLDPVRKGDKAYY